jgi:hypothetical protein
MNGGIPRFRRWLALKAELKPLKDSSYTPYGCDPYGVLLSVKSVSPDRKN